MTRRIMRQMMAAVLALALPGMLCAEDLSAWRKDTIQPVKEQWDRTMMEKPPFDAKNPSRTMRQILTLAIENNNLVLRTPLPSTPAPAPGKDGNVRIKVGDSPEWSSLQVAAGAEPAHGQVIPSNFQLASNDFGADKISSFSITRGHGRLLVGGAITRPGELDGMEIIQTEKDDDYTHPHECTMQVIKVHHIDGHLLSAPKMITFTEPDFATLMRKHPDEARQEFRPMFHRLNSDFVFATDPLIAWLVFPDVWQPDPQVVAKVNALLPALNGGTFRTRKQASKSIEELGVPGVMAIVRLDRTKLSPEQNAQLDQATLPYHLLTDDQVRVARTDPQFLMDCLYCTMESFRKAAIAQLRTVTKLDLAFDPSAAADLRIPAAAAIRAKLVAGKFIADEE